MCRYHKHSYTSKTDLKRANQEWTAIRHCYKKNKIPWNATHKERKGPLQWEVQTTADRNQRGHKLMEKHSMFMVRKNQYCENGHTAQSNL